jgi:hypothetical protein
MQQSRRWDALQWWQSERTALDESFEAASELLDAFLIGVAQAGSVGSTGRTPLEPSSLLILHVAAGAHAKQWLELSVEDCHLDILIAQLPIGTYCLLVSSLDFGAVETSSPGRLPCPSRQQGNKTREAESGPDHGILLENLTAEQIPLADRGSRSLGAVVKQG